MFTAYVVVTVLTAAANTFAATMSQTTKGGKKAVIPLAPRTARAIDLTTGERCEGPIFTTPAGRGRTGIRPGGSSAGSPAAPGWPRRPARTRRATPSSPPPPTPASRCGTSRKPPPTPIPAPP